MKWITGLLLLLAASLNAQSVIRGDIKLAYSDSAFADNVFTNEFGNVVKADARWYAGDFFGEPTVFAGITVRNTGAKPMFYH